jgi:predicted DsbA family dithiol-disulfide isomerase
VPQVRVHYDFASTLCYVAHHLMRRMASDLAELDVELAWSPLDLSSLTGWPRGAPLPEPRRANAARVARELGVEVSVPRAWPDSRWANASALAVDAAGDPARSAAWRERVFSAVFEERRGPIDAACVVALARELGFTLAEDALRSAREALPDRTREAAAQEVTGVPTFMLDAWAFGGIQSRETMRSILERWVRRRSRAADGPVPS